MTYIKNWYTKKACDFQGICLCETVKVAMSARVMTQKGITKKKNTNSS